MGQQITIDVKLPCILERSGEWFIATCPAFDVVSQGRTIEHAKSSLNDALMLFISSSIERGLFEQMLHNHGFTKVEELQNLPVHGEDYLRVDLPIFAPENRCNL